MYKFKRLRINNALLPESLATTPTYHDASTGGAATAPSDYLNGINIPQPWKAETVETHQQKINSPLHSYQNEVNSGCSTNVDDAAQQPNQHLHLSNSRLSEVRAHNIALRNKLKQEAIEAEERARIQSEMQARQFAERERAIVTQYYSEVNRRLREI